MSASGRFLTVRFSAHPNKYQMEILSYIKSRIAERSTWAAIAGGITGAAALTAPWSYVLAIAGIIGALVPTSGGDHS